MNTWILVNTTRAALSQASTDSADTTLKELARNLKAHVVPPIQRGGCTRIPRFRRGIIYDVSYPRRQEDKFMCSKYGTYGLSLPAGADMA